MLDYFCVVCSESSSHCWTPLDLCDPMFHQAKDKPLHYNATITHCGSDVGVCLSKLLPYSLSQSSHSIFSGTVEVLISTWHHSVPTHTVENEKDEKNI